MQSIRRRRNSFHRIVEKINKFCEQVRNDALRMMPTIKIMSNEAYHLKYMKDIRRRHAAVIRNEVFMRCIDEFFSDSSTFFITLVVIASSVLWSENITSG